MVSCSAVKRASHTGLRWALEGIVVAHLTVARVAEGLGVAWDLSSAKLVRNPDTVDGVQGGREVVG